MKPSWEYEERYWGQGLSFVAGVDEAGMGAWAGPVCAAVVVFGKGLGDLAGVRDSKKLTAEKREGAVAMVQGLASGWAVGEASAAEIDDLNIRAASHLAIRRAIEQLELAPELLLIDGNPAQPLETIPAVNIIKGDSFSYSIAAASILAKVHRDSLMAELDKAWPGYGFGAHKGYGTGEHAAALESLGVCAVHRKSYAPVAATLKSL